MYCSSIHFQQHQTHHHLPVLAFAFFVQGMRVVVWVDPVEVHYVCHSLVVVLLFLSEWIL